MQQLLGIPGNSSIIISSQQYMYMFSGICLSKYPFDAKLPNGNDNVPVCVQCTCISVLVPYPYDNSSNLQTSNIIFMNIYYDRHTEFDIIVKIVCIPEIHITS